VFRCGIIPCLLVLFCLSVSAQNTTSNKSLVDSIIKLPVDSTLVWLQKYETTDLENFQQIGLNTLQRAKTNADPLQIARAHQTLANWYGYHGLFAQDSTLYHSEQTLAYYEKTGDQSAIAKASRTLAIDYLRTNSLKKSQDVLFKALAIYEDLKDEQGMAGIYRVLAVLQGEMNKPQEAIKYALQAIDLYEKGSDYAALAIAHFDLIKGYTKTGEYDLAYKAADRCINLVETKAPDEVFVAIRGYSYRGDVSLATQNYKQALADYTTAWKRCVAQIGEERSLTYRTEIGNTLRLMGNYEAGLEHLLAGIEAYEETENERIWPLYDQIADCYEHLGDAENALLYFKKSDTIKQTIHQNQIATLESEALVKYETGKKDEALAAQAQLLDQKNKVQRLIIGIAALLLLLLGLLFYFLRRSKKATRKIRAKNAENELLLKEIHHRVKNNLEMVKSLIALQSAQLEDSATRDAMIASQNRVQSMGIIHQKLYQGTNLGSIEMKDYFINLSEGILDSFDAEDQIQIVCVMEDLELDVDTAVPIGLIVNELLTNALKYAFPEKHKGRIEISLSKPKADLLSLLVKDNGIGKSVTAPVQGTGFGTQLIQLLTRQLNGAMHEEVNDGTCVSFQFKLDQAA